VSHGSASTGRPAVSRRVTTPVPGKTRNCGLLRAQELMSTATLRHRRRRRRHRGRDRDPPREQTLTAAVGGAVRVSSSLPSSSLLPTPSSRCRSLSCSPLSLPILVPKKFVSKMKMKREKKEKTYLWPKRRRRRLLGHFFRSIPLVLVVSQSSVVVPSFFGCCCSLLVLLSFHAGMGSAPPPNAQSTPQAVTREAGCG
jgi:hypothetical protein